MKVQQYIEAVLRGRDPAIVIKSVCEGDTDVTARELDRVKTASISWMPGLKPSSRGGEFKQGKGKLSKAEEKVLSKVPAGGFDLGFVAQPLKYSPALRHWGKSELTALYSLLGRGELKLVRRWSKETDSESYVVVKS